MLEYITSLLSVIVSDFAVISGFVLLVGKIIFKVTMRFLGDAVGGVFGDTFPGFGVDMALFGVALVVGAIGSGRVSIAGEAGAFALLKLCGATVISLMCYGVFHKCKKGFFKYVSFTVSWICGIIPFWTAIGILQISKP